jgi:hypothetical protein
MGVVSALVGVSMMAAMGFAPLLLWDFSLFDVGALLRTL